MPKLFFLRWVGVVTTPILFVIFFLGSLLLNIFNPVSLSAQSSYQTAFSNFSNVRSTPSYTLSKNSYKNLGVVPPTSSESVSGQATPSSAGDEFLALGDSVGYGVGAPFPEQNGFAGVFYNSYLKRLQPDIGYKNLAIPGETSSSFINSGSPRNLSQLARALFEIQAAIKAGKRVSPITITVGGNDLLDARGKSAAERNIVLERYDSNLAEILSQLNRAASGKSEIILSTYYNPYAVNTGGKDEETAWVQKFNAVIKKRAAEAKAKVADFFEPFLGRESSLTWIGSGDIHPNLSGYLVLASAVWQASALDTSPPKLNLSYSDLPNDYRLTAGKRAAFKINIRDEGFNITGSSSSGAGSITTATAALDGGEKTALVAVPARFNHIKTDSQEFTFLLDTQDLSAGKHLLHFEGVDSAGNIGMLDLNFEVVL